MPKGGRHEGLRSLRITVFPLPFRDRDPVRQPVRMSHMWCRTRYPVATRFIPARSGSSGTNRIGADNFMKPVPGKPQGGIFRGRRGDPSQAPRCGAKTRRGTPCQRAKERNPHTGYLKKCRLHGGLSSGPRTAEGRARIAAANWRHGQRSKAAKEARRVLREKLAALKAKAKGKQ